MCGLVGLVRLDGQDLGGEAGALVESMCDAIAYRGPDDRGVELFGHACLGSVRLSILDLSPAGHMPMSDASGRWWIAYNGEVYNFRELRTELEGLGHELRSNTDTEVVLHAFMEWGAASLERLSGMFAFAVHDKEDGSVTLVRDRMGIKPLYYYVEGGRVAFSSEIKAIERAAGELRLDERSFAEWTLYQSIDAPTPETLLSGVRSLMPGECVRFAGQEVELESYYSPAARVRSAEFERLAAASVEAVVDEVDELVSECVVQRLMSDVPVGTLLSGGLDSSLVTAMAAREREITSFHVSVEGEFDEKPFADEVAAKYGVELVSHSFGAADFRRELPRIIRQSDLPLTHANSVAYSIICRIARERGVIVLLSGEGADELFGGYAWRYRRMGRMQRLARFLAKLPRRVRTGIELAGAVSLDLPVEARRFDQLLPQAVQLADGYARRDWRARCEAAYDFVPDADDRSLLGAMLADLNDFLTPLLRRLDRMSMGASVECRVPFLDHRMVELAIHLPLAYRVGRTADKWVLKQVAKRYLPPHLIDRKKMGFPLPLGDYLAPFASKTFFEGGFWREHLGLHPKGLEESFATCREKPFAFLALVSGEIWGRLLFLGQSVAEIEDMVARLEHEHAR